MNDGLNRKRTLTSARAGVGKTMLKCEWRSFPPASALPSAWVSLDTDDNSSARFWTYVIAALQSVDEGVGEGVRPMLRSD